MLGLKDQHRKPLYITIIAAAMLLAPSATWAVDNSYNPALPQFQVAGTEVMLYNSVRAESMGEQVREAKAALATCDEARWRKATSRIDTISMDAERQQGGAAGSFGADGETLDEDAIDDYSRALQAQWKQACAKQTAQTTGTSFSANAGISIGQFYAPRMGFLGLENPGTLIQRIGVVSVEEDARATGGNIEGSVHFSQHRLLGSNGLWFAGGYQRTTSNIRYGMNTFDPNGDTLLIPGPNGGASGFSLVTAGGLNVVNNLVYEADYEWQSVFAKGGLPFDCGEWDFMPFAGVAYTETEYMSRFQGSVPGFGRNFAYNTSLYVDTFSPFVGFAASRDLGNGISINGGGLVTHDFNDIEGTDRLSFTGAADSQANLNGDDTSMGGRAWGGVTFGTKQSPLKISLGLSYTYTDNIPVVNRDGTNASAVSLDSGEALLGNINFRLRF